MKIKFILKKFLVCLIVAVLLFNFIGAPHAEAGFLDSLGSLLGGMAEGILGILMWVVNLLIVNIARIILMLMGNIATTFGYVGYGDDGQAIYADSGSAVGGKDISMLSVGDIFFNRLLLTDINIFQVSPGNSNGQPIETMRSQIALWYYVMRVIAVSVLLGILIYVAIRMSIATIATDKARYKKMLVDWASSIVLVFMLHYLIVVIVNLNNAAVRILQNVGDSVGMDSIFETISDLCFSGDFAVELGAAVILMMLVTQTLAFLIFYVKRMLTTSFLIIISPLISITYSIDKMGDGKAQALNAWFKEFVFNIIIQPFHCIIFISFTNVALKILSEAGKGVEALAAAILAAMCIQFIWNGEKIVKQIFGIKVSESMGNAVASAAIAGSMISKATKAGTKVAKTGVKTTMKLGSKNGFIAQAAKDIGNTGFGKKVGGAIKSMPGYSKIQSGVSDFSNSIHNMADRVKDSKVGQGVRKTINGVKDFSKTETGQRFTRGIKTLGAGSVGVAAGIMTMGASYGSKENASLLESGIAGAAVGTATYSATKSLMMRKVEHFEDKVSENQNCYKQFTNEEISATALGRKADVAEKDGDLDSKKITEEFKKAMKELVDKLKVQNGLEENAAKGQAEVAMDEIKAGVYEGDLNLENIAKSLNISKEDLQQCVGGYGEKLVLSSVSQDNKAIDDLAGESGYHKRALAAMDGMSEEPAYRGYTEEETNNAVENATNDVFTKKDPKDPDAPTKGERIAKGKSKEAEYENFINELNKLMAVIQTLDPSTTKTEQNALQETIKTGMNEGYHSRFDASRINDEESKKLDSSYDLRASDIEDKLSTLDIKAPDFRANLDRLINEMITMGSNGKQVEKPRLLSQEQIKARKEYIEHVSKHVVYKKFLETNIMDIKERHHTS